MMMIIIIIIIMAIRTSDTAGHWQISPLSSANIKNECSQNSTIPYPVHGRHKFVVT